MKRGDIVQIGPHRLMCGDARSKRDVDALLGDEQVAMVFTSPPYGNQRKYDDDVGDWTDLMVSSLAETPQLKKTQVLVNIGLFHRSGQWVDYWTPWLAKMEQAGWLRLAWYVWDKLCGLPTVPARGRLYPSHEFIFHLCREKRVPNKTIPCLGAGKVVRAGPMRRPNNQKYRRPQGKIVTQTHRIADSVFRLTARGSPVVEHDAVFPPSLPAQAFDSFSDPGEIVYDPFCGSGSSILAAQQTRRVCRAMEISPRFCDLAVRRLSRSSAESVVA